MAEEERSVQDIINILSGNKDSTPKAVDIPSAASSALDTKAVEQLLNSYTAPALQETTEEEVVPEQATPLAPEDVETVLEESVVTERKPTPVSPSDIMTPVADDLIATGEKAVPEERPTRYEESVQEQLVPFYRDMTDEQKEKFRLDVAAGLKEPDGAGRVSLIQHGLSALVKNSDSGAMLTFGIIDAVSLGGAAAVDGVENALTAIGEDSKAYTAINYVVNEFGRKRLADNPRVLANQIADMFGAAGEFSETFAGFAPVRAAMMAATGRGVAEPVRMMRQAKTDVAALEQAYRNNADIARGASMEAAEEARRLASETAAANSDVAEEMIKAFEARTGKTISSEVDGRLTIDPEKARAAGRETLEEVTGEAAKLAVGEDVLTQPLLVPEKFDALVAVASEYKAKFPDAFNNDKTIIDSLFDLTVNKELVGGQELIDNLNKFGLSFEDYILTVVGSGSEAGRILNKLSQIKRARPAGDAAQQAANAAAKTEGTIRRGVMRLENVRRGLLVSQLATAARNLTSGVIRAPMESLGNVMDTAIYRATNDGALKGVGELFSGQNWKDSFADMKYIFSRPDVAKAYTDFILTRPELASQYDRMFNNINEIQALTGRGTGTAFDKIVSPLEDAADALNTPNRWQEHLIRRGVFFGELQRLTRNEYGIDLIDTLQSGKLQDLLNDASSVKPENARSFLGIVDQAVTKSLDVTYAKMPEIPVFRSTSQFIVRNGLTTVVEFPRFMFNSMELMGQYAGGASIPLTRKLSSLVMPSHRGPLTAKDRERITRNIMGMAAIGAAYQYRTSEDAPADYKQMNTSEGVVMDTSPQYPMRQFLYIGEATKRVMDGTFDDWFKAREFAETFAGSSLRTGTGNAMLEEVASLADGTDLTKGEAVGSLLGSAFGQYLSTWAVPFAQLIEAQRAVGERGLEYKDVREDPTLDGMTTFFNELSRPFAQRGISTTAEEEAAFPNREFVFSEEARRVSPMSRVLLGLNQSTVTEEYGQYFVKKGFNEYDLSSRSEVPTVQRWENKQIREVLPIIAEVAQKEEDRLRTEYDSKSDTYRDTFTVEEHVNNNVIPLINTMVRDVRTDLSKIPVGAEDQYTNAIVQYRRVPPEFRKLATNYFVEQFDRNPDPANTEDLQSLTMLGISLRKAYGK